MKKRILIAAFFSLALAASLAATAAPAFGEKPPPSESELPEQFRDANRNKIFDNLEKRMGPAGVKDPFGVIVQFTQPLSKINFPRLKKQLGSFNIRYEYPSVDAISTVFTKGQIVAAAKHDLVKQMEYNGEMRIFLDNATLYFGVQKARADFSVYGDYEDVAPEFDRSYAPKDIVIAIIDTGIDYKHVDLDGGKMLGGYDFVNDDTDPMDDHGHGTHVASIAAGEGDGDPAYTGVAPGAALVGVKVLDRRGSGTWEDCNAGIQWVIDNKDTFGIDILNISWGAAGSSDGTSVTEQLVNKAVATGIVAAVSAGNEGPKKYTIGVPAAAEEAITVGAMADVNPGVTGVAALPEKGFYQAYFSSRGPTADERIKPDISAPGVAITAAEYDTTSKYVAKSGTSMSTPFVAGVAALMLDANPTLVPSGYQDPDTGFWIVDSDPLRDMIMGTAVDWGPSGTDIDYGAGRLDAYEAIKSAAGLSGINITVPGHQYFTGNLTATGDEDWFDINVTNASYPIAITLVIPDWVQTHPVFEIGLPDFDIFLYAPDDTEVASSEGQKRQETIGYQPGVTGTYKLKVDSYSGSGNYFFDRSSASPTVTSCDASGNERNQFLPGEDVYVRGIWFETDTSYKVWIQPDPVIEGQALNASSDPSGAQELPATDPNGNLAVTEIWSIPPDATPTYQEWDIVVDKAGNGTYNAADDGIDDATVAGITAPIPEASTLVLLITGLLCLFGISYSRRRRERQM